VPNPDRRAPASIADEVLAHIDPVDLRDLAVSLVQIPSENPPGEENAVAAFVESCLRSRGLETSFVPIADGRRSVAGVFRGHDQRPRLVLNGHLDVVPAGEGWSYPPYGGTVVGQRLYGRGAADMKGGLAAMIVAVAAVQRSGITLRGSVELQAAVDEEDRLQGSRALLEAGCTADHVIIAEPTGLRPYVAHKGELYVDIVTHGRAAHSSQPERGRNAIYDMAQVLDGIRRLQDSLDRVQHPLLGSPTISVGTIAGGRAPNAVPAECTIRVDRRLLPGESADAAVAELRRVLDTCVALDPAFNASLQVVLDVPPMEVSLAAPVVRSIQGALRRVLGRDPEPGGLSGTCDATWFVRAGIPTVIVGPGDLGVAHAPDEYVDLNELHQAAQVYALAILDLVG
jgi:succinyl-diaminopimelate desuccinylase